MLAMAANQGLHPLRRDLGAMDRRDEATAIKRTVSLFLPHTQLTTTVATTTWPVTATTTTGAYYTYKADLQHHRGSCATTELLDGTEQLDNVATPVFPASSAFIDVEDNDAWETCFSMRGRPYVSKTFSRMMLDDAGRESPEKVKEMFRQLEEVRSPTPVAGERACKRPPLCRL